MTLLIIKLMKVTNRCTCANNPKIKIPVNTCVSSPA